jgi:hypothetical protein
MGYGLGDRSSILVVEGIRYSLHDLHIGSAEAFFTALAYSLPHSTEIKSVELQACLHYPVRHWHYV